VEEVSEVHAEVAHYLYVMLKVVSLLIVCLVDFSLLIFLTRYFAWVGASFGSLCYLSLLFLVIL
jgi:hypothetical protein